MLCAIGWRGSGYSPEFTENMNAIVLGRLRADPQTPVVFTVMADAICRPCPSRRGMGCAADDRIGRLDRRHAAALGIRSGQRMTWAEAQARATARLRPGDLGRICSGCQWLDLGMCQSALADLQRAEAGRGIFPPDQPAARDGHDDAPAAKAALRGLRDRCADAKSAP
ncbi:DUF1284 domain-containing protein [Paracoccus sp. PS-1]|uniref:DUF1284 domain-containing protein n=1 Tax=unclassified Paracoccus (in: a-proteobacteria) TaxID=2688777 RepID=UPI0004B95A6B|nr:MULTISPECIES: DUF1284 domain-containing protein [unclassified Paracoccus (in: a-proteobacteria)]MDQ7264019.1 DUF1284 domain-containing protein [Paracoccus sp. PS1]RQP07374.1 MAG: DUF1284 domain-containing protein [Paracoccus sp. BP8]